MQKVLIATTNPGKLREIGKFLDSMPVQFVSLADVGISKGVSETGSTFLENSRLKAVTYAKQAKLPTISDDGGLMINALDGAPGINSRRWLGYEASDKDLYDHMKKVVAGLHVNNRKAQFKTVISFALPNGKVWSRSGQVQGILTDKPAKNPIPGFPYRSFFIIPQINKYYLETEMTDTEIKKYAIRFKAIERLKPILQKELNL